MQLKEVDIKQVTFISKVYQNQMPTIDHKAYEKSQATVQRLIERYSCKRTKAKQKKNLKLFGELSEKIEKLVMIDRAFQKALEIY